jgi:hypothetical protein
VKSDPVVNILGPFDGAQIPGGCDQCDAYQTAAAVQAGIWVITVHHDNWCPSLRAMQKRRGQ